jgi:hypothetical protein
LTIIALIAFCLWRKNRDAARNNQPVADAGEVEAMQFDWDKIEDHFIEVPAHNSAPHTPTVIPAASIQQHSNIHAVDDDMTTTTTNSPLIATETLVSSSNGSTQETGQYLLTSAVNAPRVVKPSALNDNSRADITITKPDGV